MPLSHRVFTHKLPEVQGSLQGAAILATLLLHGLDSSQLFAGRHLELGVLADLQVVIMLVCLCKSSSEIHPNLNGRVPTVESRSGIRTTRTRERSDASTLGSSSRPTSRRLGT